MQYLPHLHHIYFMMTIRNSIQKKSKLIERGTRLALLLTLAVVVMSCSSDKSRFNEEANTKKNDSVGNSAIQDSISKNLSLVWEMTLSIKDSLNGYVQYDSKKKKDELERVKMLEGIDRVDPEIVLFQKDSIVIKNNLHGSNFGGIPNHNLETYFINQKDQIQQPSKWGIERCNYWGSSRMVLSLDFDGIQFLLKHDRETKKVTYGKVIDKKDSSLCTVSVDGIDLDVSVYKSYFIRLYDKGIVLMNTEMNDVFIFDCDHPSVMQLKLPHSQVYIGHFGDDKFVVYDGQTYNFLIKNSLGDVVGKINRSLEEKYTHSPQFYYSASDSILVEGHFDQEKLMFHLNGYKVIPTLPLFRKG